MLSPLQVSVELINQLRGLRKELAYLRNERKGLDHSSFKIFMILSETTSETLSFHVLSPSLLHSMLM